MNLDLAERCFRVFFGVVLAAFAVPEPPPNAESPVPTPLDRQGPGNADGIGKFYQGREIAAVMLRPRRRGSRH